MKLSVPILSLAIIGLNVLVQAAPVPPALPSEPPSSKAGPVSGFDYLSRRTENPAAGTSQGNGNTWRRFFGKKPASTTPGNLAGNDLHANRPRLQPLYIPNTSLPDLVRSPSPLGGEHPVFVFAPDPSPDSLGGSGVSSPPSLVNSPVGPAHNPSGYLSDSEDSDYDYRGKIRLPDDRDGRARAPLVPSPHPAPEPTSTPPSSSSTVREGKKKPQKGKSKGKKRKKRS